jgi:hypothetical protein
MGQTTGKRAPSSSSEARALIVREANLVIETSTLQPDQFVQVMKERVLDLEGAE